MLQPEDLNVPTLGECRYASLRTTFRNAEFVDARSRIRYQQEVGPRVPQGTDDLTFEKAGPRERIYFDPETTTAAVVTCGGLSPGLNNVIRSIYLELTHNYGVHRVLGIRNGYQGLNPEIGLKPIELTGEYVEQIHKLGGTVLGSSRGNQELNVMVDFLESEEIDILFCLGGDGTQRGAHAIFQEMRRRGLDKSVVGIPKTIDNDISFVWMTFGYITALEKAEEVLRGAHIEAKGAPNGIVIVKLMGRDAGFIAAGAALANNEANFVLVPEVAFPLEGDDGLLSSLDRRMKARGHALIVVAEGAGQHLLDRDENRQDPSGNVLHEDIGIFLRDRIKHFFAARDYPVTVKYIDPSYTIRSVPANAWDRILADLLARSAVHAGMAGKTDVLMGYWNTELIHVPIGTAVARKKQMDPSGELWRGVLSATGQPRW